MADSSKDLIVNARKIFNRAIVDKNAEAIRALLVPDYHIVNGRSAQNHGAVEESFRWADLFRSDPTAVYERTPKEILVNEEWGIAQETGEWRGNYTADNQLASASGVYSAKWQRAQNGSWLVQVEVFTTLHCDGTSNGCLPPDPI